MKKDIVTLLVLLLFSVLPFGALHTCAQQAEQSLPAQRQPRMAVIGDSYVRNHREPVENTWHYKLARKYGMEYLNYGRNGGCVSIDRQRFGPALWKRWREMADSLDLIVIIAGHNDAVLLDSMGIDVYRQRLGEVCQGLIDRYPAAHIVWFTPWNNDDAHFLQVVDATIDVCGQWGIPVFDAYRKSNIFARNDRFRAIYFQGGGKNDHAHLNARGHDRFLPVAEHFLLPYLPSPCKTSQH